MVQGWGIGIAVQWGTPRCASAVPVGTERRELRKDSLSLFEWQKSRLAGNG